MYIYHNGSIKQKEAVNLSVDDRGYTFGEGVYEVVRVYAGEIFTLDEHWRRLERNVAEVEIILPDYFTKEHLRTAINELVNRNSEPESWVYLQVTRGVQFRSHGFATGLTPVITMYLIAAGDWAEERQGVKAALAEDIRWQRCDIKTTMLMPNTLVKTRAARDGYFEVIFERDGFITEGSSSNVFFVKDELLITPPLSHRILPGITREYIVKLADRLGIQVEQRPVKVEELAAMQEIFITATGIEAIPVNALGELSYQSPGKVFSRLMAEFQRDIDQLSKR